MTDLKSWEGIGATGKRFGDYHAFILTAKPCWAASVPPAYPGQDIFSTPNASAREEKRRFQEMTV
jgi:hypothetical protein